MAESRGVRGYYDSYWRPGARGWSPRRVGTAALEPALLGSLLRPGARVLDIGCGDGRLAGVCRALGARYLGLDVSPAAVRACRARGVAARVHDLGAPLPFRPGAFDVVVTFEVLEHLFDPALVVREARRVLARGGAFAGSVPNAAALGHRLLWLLGRPNPGGSPETSLTRPWADPHIRFFSPRTLAALLRDAGGFSAPDVRGTAFSPLDLPRLYRLRPGAIRSVLAALGAPLGGLGAVWPALFASRLLFVCRK